MNSKKERRERRFQSRGMLWRWASVPKTCKRLQSAIKEYIDQIEQATDIKPQVLTGMPHSNVKSDPTQKSAECLAGISEVLNQRLDNISQRIKEELEFESKIDQAVGKLTGIEQAVINGKYKDRKRYEEIAPMLGYCVDRIKQIEGDAVDKVWIEYHL